MLERFATLFQDAPPSHVFELSEAGIAYAPISAPNETQFRPLEAGVISVSPVRDNVQNVDVLAAHIKAIAPANGNKRRPAALIVPDYCARVAVLDFDAFPSNAEEQQALVRFRTKKSVPFDVDSAALSYYAQPRRGADGKIEVVVAVMALEIVSRYEAPFRAAGFQPGLVTTSALAALNLIAPDEVSLLVKLSGRTLTVLVLDGRSLKLSRCVEMEQTEREEIEAVLHPTFAYVEDELNTKARRVLLCGFGALGEQLGPLWASEWGVAAETIRSRYGAPGEANAGLLGFLEAARA